MLAKISSLLLVYILTIINFTILFFPWAALFLPFIHFSEGQVIVSYSIFSKIKYLALFLSFIVSFLMLVYMFLDFLLGISQRSLLKDCKRYDKVEGVGFLGELLESVRKRFGERRVKLYIKSSGEVNAFAVGSLGRKTMVLTSGLLTHYAQHSRDNEEFLITVRSIMGHEMSHLINKDFLPGLLLMVNQNVTNFVSAFLQSFLRLLVDFLALLRIRGAAVTYLFMVLYKITNGILTLFDKYVVGNLYEFLRKLISRSIEYRCDRQSAQAFGGYNMALALSFLGKSGYFTLFSTHPSTKSRIRRVEKISPRERDNIRPLFSSFIANYLSVISLIIICLASAKATGVDLAVRYYIDNHQGINDAILNGSSYIYKIYSYLFSLIKSKLF